MIECERSIETSLSGVTRCLGLLLSTLPVALDEKNDDDDDDEGNDDDDDEWEEVKVTTEKDMTTEKDKDKNVEREMSNSEWAREYGIHDASSYRLALTVNVGT